MLDMGNNAKETYRDQIASLANDYGYNASSSILVTPYTKYRYQTTYVRQKQDSGHPDARQCHRL